MGLSTFSDSDWIHRENIVRESDGKWDSGPWFLGPFVEKREESKLSKLLGRLD